MNTLSYTTHAVIHSITLAGSLCLGMVGAPAQAESLAMLTGEDSWQTRNLFEPSRNQRALEEKGRITIYDGLRETMVNQALDSQFNRIQNMMFTRIIRTDNDGEPLRDATGEVVVEDDGC